MLERAVWKDAAGWLCAPRRKHLMASALLDWWRESGLTRKRGTEGESDMALCSRSSSSLRSNVLSVPRCLSAHHGCKQCLKYHSLYPSCELQSGVLLATFLSTRPSTVFIRLHPDIVWDHYGSKKNLTGWSGCSNWVHTIYSWIAGSEYSIDAPFLLVLPSKKKRQH